MNDIFEKLIKDKNGNLLESGYYIWKTLVSSLNKKFNELGFLEAHFFNLDSSVNSECKYQISSYSLEGRMCFATVSKYTNMIEGAKTAMIDILQAYVSTTKNVLSTNLYYGKKILFNGEEEYIFGINLMDKGFIEFGKVIFEHNEGFYIIKSFYYMDSIENIIYLLKDDEGMIIPPYASIHNIYIIPLKMNENNVLSSCKKLKDYLLDIGYRVYLDERKIKESEKLIESTKKGVPIIIEVGPRDIMNNVFEVKRRIDNNFINVDEGKLESYISNLLKKEHIELINRQIKSELLNVKNIMDIDELSKSLNEGYICNIIYDGKEDTFKSLQEKIPNGEFILPFNQTLFSEQDLISKEKGKYLVSIFLKK